jgi:hypothetical protein
VWGIQINHAMFVEFLQGAGYWVPEAPGTEDPVSAAAAVTSTSSAEEKPSKPAAAAGGPKVEKAAGGKIEEELRSTKPWIEHAIGQQRAELVGLSTKAAAEKLAGWMRQGLYSPQRVVGWNRIRAIAKELKLLPIGPA